MLIKSHRHTAGDLALWQEMREGDLANGESLVRSKKIRRAATAVSEFLDVGPAYCGCSWGKDSIAVAHLLWTLRKLDVPLVRLRPTNAPSETDATRDAYFSQFPGQPYHEVAVEYGDLHATIRDRNQLDRETNKQWNAAIRECERRFGQRRILGIRGAESPGRMVRMCRWGVSSPNACAPIGWWSTADVYAYLALHDLPVHPAYAMLGGGRWARERIRVAEIGDTHGTGSGRREWEMDYFGDVLRRLESQKSL